MLKATYKDVGLLAYPFDSSYCKDLETGLEGGITSTSKVKIMSRPFKLKFISSTKKLLQKEFVLVKDSDDNPILMLNSFKEITNEK